MLIRIALIITMTVPVLMAYFCGYSTGQAVKAQRKLSENLSVYENNYKRILTKIEEMD